MLAVEGRRAGTGGGGNDPPGRCHAHPDQALQLLPGSVLRVLGLQALQRGQQAVLPHKLGVSAWHAAAAAAVALGGADGSAGSRGLGVRWGWVYAGPA